MDIATIGIWGSIILVVVRIVETALVSSKNDTGLRIIGFIKEFFKIG